MHFLKNVFLPIFIFTLFFAVSEQQECHFDTGGRYPRILVDEIQIPGVFSNLTSSRITDITDLPQNSYIRMTYTVEDGEGTLDVELTNSLKDYYRDPSNGNNFTFNFRTTCPPGPGSTTSIINATILVIDFNDPPEFDAPTSTFVIQTPWVLDLPVNHDQDISVLDWDYNPAFTELSFSTSDPKVRVVGTQIPSDTRPKTFSLKLFLTEQLTEPLNFNVLAQDADLSIDPVSHAFEIQVEPLNIYPPTFAKHFYKSEKLTGPGLPVRDEEIIIDGDPIIANDREGKAFSVSTNSDLIRAEVDIDNPGAYKIYFDRDVTEDDLKIDRGIVVIDLTVTADGFPELSSTIVFLLYLPESSEVTLPSTIATESTCPPCGTTDANLPTTCPEITTAVTECPETTTVAECPESTPCDCTSPVTEFTCEPCPSTTTVTSSVTDCPEISTIYVSTPCPENTDKPVTSDTTSASPVTECPDVCTTPASEQPSSACPEQTTISVSTPCPEIPDCTTTPNTPITSGTSDCPVTDCPDVCITPSAGPESTTYTPPAEVTCPTTCEPCENPEPCTPEPCTPLPCTPEPCTPRPCTPEPCTPRPCVPEPGGGDSDDDDCSNTGFIVGLVVLSVLLVICLGVAGYLWFKLRKNKNDPLKGLTPAERWVPDIVEPMNLDNDKEFLVSPREIDPIPGPSYSVVSDSPRKLKKQEPVNFGTMGRGNPPDGLDGQELSQATNPLVDSPAPVPEPASSPIPAPASIPEPEPVPAPAPAIPKPDYHAGVVFDETVQVFTPAPQEYPSSDEDEEESNKNEATETEREPVASDTKNEVMNDDNEGDEKL